MAQCKTARRTDFYPDDKKKDTKENTSGKVTEGKVKTARREDFYPSTKRNP